jgi:hypothetical protein
MIRKLILTVCGCAAAAFSLPSACLNGAGPQHSVASYVTGVGSVAVVVCGMALVPVIVHSFKTRDRLQGLLLLPAWSSASATHSQTASVMPRRIAGTRWNGKPRRSGSTSGQPPSSPSSTPIWRWLSADRRADVWRLRLFWIEARHITGVGDLLNEPLQSFFNEVGRYGSTSLVPSFRFRSHAAPIVSSTASWRGMVSTIALHIGTNGRVPGIFEKLSCGPP